MAFGKSKAEPVAEAPAESLSRLQIVERSGRALKMLLPLAAMCDELAKFDNIERATADAQVRHDQLLADLAKVRVGIEAEHDKLRAAGGEIVGKAQAQAAEALGQAQAKIAAAQQTAQKRAETEQKAFEQRAGAMHDTLEGLAAKITTSEAERDALLAQSAGLRAEVAAAEAKLAAARKQAAKALGELAA